MGYYGGDGARKVATVSPRRPAAEPGRLPRTTPRPGWSTAATGPSRPPGRCRPTPSRGSTSPSSSATDGASGGSHIFFIVRDDDGGSDLLFQTSDTTWQAYNQYGGNSLYTGWRPGRIRPRLQGQLQPPASPPAGATPEDSLFNAEYPMVRWLERNGYDVSYFTGVDTDRLGERDPGAQGLPLGRPRRVLVRGPSAANVEAARDAGVNLAFFSGNEVFWKTRWENSIDGSDTDHRTLVSYKETHANAKIDPTPESGPGPGAIRASAHPPTAASPENALTGTMFRVNSGTSAIEVPAADGKMRLWRNTTVASLASGQTATLTGDTLGYEWDEALDNGFRPAGAGLHVLDHAQRRRRSSRTTAPPTALGTATHHLTLYPPRRSRAARWSSAPAPSSGPGASTATTTAAAPHPTRACSRPRSTCSPTWAPSPARSRAAWSPATASTDTDAPELRRSPRRSTAPTSRAASRSRSAAPPRTPAERPAAARSAGVEVSTDGGATWHPAQGRANWTYSWTPGATGSATIKTRAADDSGNLETPGAGVTVNVIPRDLPLLDLGRLLHRARARTTRTRSSSASSSAPTRPASSPACASTRRPATPAPTSATCGLRTAPSWPRPPSAERPPPAGSR